MMLAQSTVYLTYAWGYSAGRPFILFSNYCYGLNNQEIRLAVQDWINSQEYPKEMDELTIIVDIITTSWGNFVYL